MSSVKSSLLQLLTIALAAMVSFSCSKDKKDKDNDDGYICTTCTTTPIAVTANNTVNKGIYKGVLIGSSGTLLFNVQNTTNSISGTMVIDGVVVNLVCNDVVNSNADFVGTFTGSLNSSVVTIHFRVSKDGSSPQITSATIPGHPDAVFLVAKETSDVLLECYEGTYSITGDWSEQGTYNFLVARKNGSGKWSAIAAEDGYPDEFTSGEGFMSGNDVIDANRLGQGKDVVIATISGHTITGNFVDTDSGETATIKHKGRRTL